MWVVILDHCLNLRLGRTELQGKADKDLVIFIDGNTGLIKSRGQEYLKTPSSG